MESSIPIVTLNDGNKLPQIGLGTYQSKEGDVLAITRSAILENGYILIDTAKVYENEEQIGEALQECFEKGIKRENIYIVTKLWMRDNNDPEAALRESLKKLRLDYVDLYIMHWMFPIIDWENGAKITTPPVHVVWSGMEKLKEKGLTRSIGVSNANCQLLLDLLAGCKIKPAVNQIEVHPYCAQHDLTQFFKKNFGIITMAYAPLGSPTSPLWKNKEAPKLFEEKPIVALSEKYSRSPAQIVLNWNLNEGNIIIPKTTNPKRLHENLNVYDFKMTEEEYQSITALNCGARGFDAKNIGGAVFNNMPYFD